MSLFKKSQKIEIGSQKIKIIKKDIEILGEIYRISLNQEKEIYNRLNEDIKKFLSLREEFYKAQRDLNELEASGLANAQIISALKYRTEIENKKFGEDKAQELTNKITNALSERDIRKKRDELKKEFRLAEIKLKTHCKRMNEISKKILEKFPKSKIGGIIEFYSTYHY